MAGTSTPRTDGDAALGAACGAVDLPDDLAHLLGDLDATELGDLLPPVLGPLQGVLALYPAQYRLGYQDEQGVYRTRWLAPAALRRAVLAEALDLGWLPPGTLTCGIGAAGPWIVQSLHAARQTVQIRWQDRDSETLTVPLPPLVFLGYGTEYFLYATTEGDPTPTTPLCYAPLPNVYPSGRICWGNNHPPACSAATMADAWRLFLSSPFNGDLTGNKSRRFPDDVRWRLHDLATRSRRPARYPLRDLVPMRLPLHAALRQVVQDPTRRW
jgi:PRTRC genetic system protein B